MTYPPQPEQPFGQQPPGWQHSSPPPGAGSPWGGYGAPPPRRRTGLWAGLSAGAVAIVAFLITGLVAPGYLVGEGDPQAWADDVCSAAADDMAALRGVDAPSPTDITTAKQQYGEALATFSTALDGIISAFEEAGEPPVEGGAGILSTVLRVLNDAKDEIDGARAAVAGLPESASRMDLQAAVRPVAEVGRRMQQMGEMSMFGDDPELAKAFENTESCRSMMP